MTVAITTYQDLVTSEHSTKPKFMGLVSATVSGFVDLQNFIQSFPDNFDVDAAYWAQLDGIGQRIGMSRNLQALAPGFHIPAPANVVPLLDAYYSILIHSKIKTNTWLGTIADAVRFAPNLLGAGSNVFIVDLQNMTMQIAVAGVIPNTSMQAALVGGYLELRPAGVLCEYYIPSVPGPLFGFDSNNTNIAGFDTGVWAIQIG